MLRAFLAFRMKRAKATQIAASVGQLLAIVFTMFGLFYNPFLLFIGVFVFLGAGAESRQVSLTESLKEIKATDIMTGNFQSISLSATVSHAASVMQKNQSSELVVTNGDIFIGMISYQSVINALQAGKTEYPAVELIQEDVITLNQETLLVELIDNIRPNYQSLYPVVREDKLLGVVTEKELNNLLLERQARLSQQE